MDPAVREALERDRTVDITTTGRKTGQPRRIEIWFYQLEGRTFLTGSPGTRDWYANLLAHPRFTFHLKQTVRRDLQAGAEPITDPGTRREILSHLFPRIKGEALEERVGGSPLVEVFFEEER